MHDKFWAPVAPKVRTGGLVLVNEATFEQPLDEERYQVIRAPATDIAIGLGNELGGSMVMAGVCRDHRSRRSRRDGRSHAPVDPPYRRQHIAANEVAIRAGFDAVEQLAFPAWEQEAARA